MGSDIPDYMRYWGKAKELTYPESDDYHLLAYHCLDVAACGYQMVIDNRFHAADILAEIGFSRADGAYWFAYFLALHDIGKFARGFQQLYPHNNSALVPDAGRVYRPRHDSLGYWLWQNHILSRWLDDNIALLPDDENKDQCESSLNIWLQLVTGHHGEPPENTNGALAFTREDMLATESYLLAIQTVFLETSFPPQFADKTWRRNLKTKLVAGWTGRISGLVRIKPVLFPFVAAPMALANYWKQAQRRAQHAIASLPSASVVNADYQYQHIFPFIRKLSPLQQDADEADISSQGSQLFILEDVTGAGKRKRL